MATVSWRLDWHPHSPAKITRSGNNPQRCSSDIRAIIYSFQFYAEGFRRFVVSKDDPIQASEQSAYFTLHSLLMSAILLSIILLYSPVPTLMFSPSCPVRRPIAAPAGTIEETPDAI